MSYVLKVGSSGTTVESLQEGLVANKDLTSINDLGQSNIDGRFGAITREAVMNFQTSHGLANDGVVGRATATALALSFDPPSIREAAVHILTNTQINRLAEIIDAIIPTGPFDYFDDEAIKWLVEKIDRLLADMLPPGLIAVLQDLSSGLEGADLPSIRNRMVKTLNQKINVALLPEDLEGKIIGFFIDAVIEALKVGRTFDDALRLLSPRLSHS